MRAMQKRATPTRLHNQSTRAIVLLVAFLSYFAATASAAWDVRGKRVALHAQSSSLVHGFVAGSEYTCLGLKAALISSGAAHVRIFSPGLYGALEDDPSTVWDEWDLVVIEGWFDMLPSFVHAVRTSNEPAFLRRASHASSTKLIHPESKHSAAERSNVDRRSKGPIVLYYCLDVYSPEFLEKIMNLNVDGYLTNSKVLMPTLQAIAPTLLMHLAVDPERMNRVTSPRQEYQHPIVFVGQLTAKKTYLLPMLREAAATGQLAIYGFGWNASEPLLRSAYRGVLPVDDLCEVYSGSGFVIGTTDDLQREHGMVNNRVFEALACGAFLVSDHFEALEQTVGESEGVYFYKQDGDVRRILQTRGKVANTLNIAGQQAVRSRHTYDHRVVELANFLENVDKSGQGAGCINALRIGVLYMRPTALSQDNFDNGFVSALQVLEATDCYDITWINLATMTKGPCETFATCGGAGSNGSPLSLQVDVETHFSNLDVLLVKSNWEWYPDMVTRQLLRDLNMRKGLVISGVGAPPSVDEMAIYDVLFYETQWYMPQITDHPSIEQAFGVNTELLRPMPDVPKQWDVLSIGSIVDYKRHELLLDDARTKRVAIVGEIVDVELADRLRQAQIVILEPVAYEKLATLINSAKAVRITAGLSGGGERAVLEARACGVPVQVEGDNPKLQELVGLEHVPDHRDYAYRLQRGLTRMFCLGRGRASIRLSPDSQRKHSEPSGVEVGKLVHGGIVHLSDPTVFPITPVIEHFDLGTDGFWCLFVRMPFRTDGAVFQKCTSDTRVEMFLCLSPPSAYDPSASSSSSTSEVSFRVVLRSNVFVDEIRSSEWITVKVQRRNNSRASNAHNTPVCVGAIDPAKCEAIITNSDPYATLTHHDLSDQAREQVTAPTPDANNSTAPRTSTSKPDDGRTSTSKSKLDDGETDPPQLPVYVASKGVELLVDLRSIQATHLWTECEDYECTAEGTIRVKSLTSPKASHIPVSVSLWGQGSLALRNTVRRSLVVTVKSPFTITFEREHGQVKQTTPRQVTRFLLLSLFEDSTRMGYLAATDLLVRDSVLWFPRHAPVHLRVALGNGNEQNKGLATDLQSAGLYLMVEYPLDAIAAHASTAELSVSQVAQRDNDDTLLGWDTQGKYGAPVQGWSNAYAALHSMRADDTSVQHVESILDLPEYMTWMAINSLLLNGDSIDEAFFYSVYGGDSKEAANDPSDIAPSDKQHPPAHVLPWDLDTIFSPCHLNGVRDVRDPLLFCAESVVDRLMSRHKSLRTRFQTILARVLSEHTPRMFCGRNAGVALFGVMALWNNNDMLCASFDRAPGCDSDLLRAQVLQSHIWLCDMFEQRHEQLLDRLSAEISEILPDEYTPSTNLNEENSEDSDSSCEDNGASEIFSQVWKHLRMINGRDADENNWPDVGVSEFVIALPAKLFASDHQVVIKVTFQSPGTAAEHVVSIAEAGGPMQRIDAAGLYVVHICINGKCDMKQSCDVQSCDVRNIASSKMVVVLDPVRGASEFGLEPWTPALHVPEWESHSETQRRGGDLVGLQMFIPRAFPTDLDGQALALPLHITNVRRRNGEPSEWVHEPRRVSLTVQAVSGAGGNGYIHAPPIDNGHTLKHVVLPLGHGVLMIDVLPTSAAHMDSYAYHDDNAVVDVHANTVRASAGGDGIVNATSVTSAQTQELGLTVHVSVGGSTHVLQVELESMRQGEATSAHAWRRVQAGASICENCTVTWPSGSRVHLNGSLTLQPNATLIIEAGSVVVVTGGETGNHGGIVLGGGARLLVNGTPDQPVIFTAPGAESWGGIVASGKGSDIQLRHTTLLRTGAGPSVATGVYGHRAERAALTLSHGASLSMVDCVLAHGVGQALAVANSSVVLLRTLVQGFQAGGEVFHSNTTLTQSVLTDFPDRSPQYSDGDSDGLYVVGGRLTATHSIFAHAKDDCVDSGTGVGGQLFFDRCSFVSCFHEGLAITSQTGAPKTVLVKRSLFLNNQQGIEVGWTAPDTSVVVEGSWFIGNQVAVRYGDNYAAPVHGHLVVVNSTFSGNGQEMWAYVRDHNPHSCQDRDGSESGSPGVGSYSVCHNMIWDQLVGEDGRLPTLVHAGSVRIAEIDNTLTSGSVGKVTMENNESESIQSADVAPVVLELKAGGVLVQVRRGETPDFVAARACLEIAPGDDSGCIEQLTTYISNELEFVSYDADEVDNGGDGDVVEGDGMSKTVRGKRRRQRALVEIQVSMDGRPTTFRMHCGDDVLLRTHLFCKSLGQGYDCFKAISAAVLRWLAADEIVCVASQSSIAQHTNTELPKRGGDTSFPHFHVSTATIDRALARLPRLTSVLEHSVSCEAAKAIADKRPILSVTCVTLLNGTAAGNSPRQDKEGCDACEGRLGIKGKSRNLIIASQPSLSVYVPDMARAPDMVDVQLCLSGCVGEVTSCSDVLVLLGNLLSLARYTILIPAAWQVPNDVECVGLANDAVALLTRAASLANMNVRVSYIGIASAYDGSVSDVLMVEVTRLTRSADHHMRASHKLGWQPNHYDMRLGGSDEGGINGRMHGKRREPWAVRARDGKTIPFRYVGLTLNTLLELNPDRESRALLARWFADTPVTEDMAPWNLVFTRGAGLVFVDEQARLVSELNVNYMYTLVKLHDGCVWDANKPVQAFQQCMLRIAVGRESDGREM